MLTVVKRQRPKGSPQEFLLVPEGKTEPIGLLMKYADTRTEKHPWKAFYPIGQNAQMIGTFYPEQGGKKAAIQAVEKAYGK